MADVISVSELNHYVKTLLDVNDSLFDLGNGKDRHARIGEGFIGLDALRTIAHHEAFRGLPMILETPNEPPEHGDEIRLLRA